MKQPINTLFVGLSSSIMFILLVTSATSIIVVIILAKMLVRTKASMLQRNQRPDDTLIYDDIVLSDRSKDIRTDLNVAYSNIPKNNVK